MTRAFVFPGQGSQQVGMGQELAGAFSAARLVFEEVDEAPHFVAGTDVCPRLPRKLSQGQDPYKPRQGPVHFLANQWGHARQGSPVLGLFAFDPPALLRPQKSGRSSPVFVQSVPLLSQRPRLQE